MAPKTLNKYLKKIAFLFIYTSFVFGIGKGTEAFSQGSYLDQTFGNKGVVITSNASDGDDDAVKILIQPDGKLVTTGFAAINSKYVITVNRYNPDGSLDQSFGNNGVVYTDIGGEKTMGNSAELQQDGKIVVVGGSDTKTSTIFGSTTLTNFVVIRYNNDGSLDNTFGNGGSVITSYNKENGYARDVKIQKDGKIVVGGYFDGGSTAYYDFALIRYNTDGSLDTSFGNNGIAITNFNNNSEVIRALEIQQDGKIVVTGQYNDVNTNQYSFITARYNINGSLDNSFGNSGMVLDNYGESYDLALRTDEKIIVVGSLGSDVKLMQYNNNGIIDQTFGQAGISITNSDSIDYLATSLAIQSDHKIVVGGWANNNKVNNYSRYDFVVFRYNSDGSIDSSFGNGGIIITPIKNGNFEGGYSIAIQTDMKILQAGISGQTAVYDNVILRYIGNCVQPIVTANTSSTICHGSSVTLNGNGANTYSWSDGITNGVAFTPTIGVHNYTVIGTNNDACKDTATTTVTVNSLPIIIAHANFTTVCKGASIVLTGTSTPLSAQINYFWSDGVNDGVGFTPTSTKTYTVIGTDANNCSASDNVTVHVNDLPIVSANTSANSVCKGNSVTLSGALTPLSAQINYSWTDGVNDGVSFTPSSTKTYTVTGTGANNCSASDNITIQVNDLPIISSSSNIKTVCSGASIILTGTSTPLSAQMNYSWSDGVVNGVAFTISSTKTFTVTGSDANNCLASDTLTILVNNTSGLDVLAHASPTSVCAGASTTLNGQGAISYVWSNGIIDGVSFIPTATHTYTLTGSNNNGCSDTKTITITVNQLPFVTANASALISCAGSPITLFGTSTTLSTPMNYSWTNGITDGVAFVPSAATTYTVIGTDDNNCSAADQITINVSSSPAPIVSATASNSTLCEGGSVILNGTSTPLSAQMNYSWTIGITDGVSFTPSSTSTYTVTGTNTGGCSGIASINIVVNAVPTVSINASATTVCQGTPTMLSGLGASSYTWSDGVNDGIAFVPTSTKTYTVTGTNQQGCSGSATITITVLTSPPPVVTANATANTVCSGSLVTLTGGGASSYTWTNAVTDGIAFSPLSTADYTVTGTDNFGCSSSATTSIVVKQLPVVIARASYTTICAGDSIYLSSEGNAFSFSWVGNMKDSLNFAPAATHTYTLTGTAQNGCSTPNTVTVVVYSLPLVGVNGIASKTLICSGDSVILAGSGADKYYWSGGIKDRKAFYPLTTSSYTLTGITNNTCDNTTSITIQVNKSPVVNPVVSPSSAAVCKGSPITLYGTTTTTSAQMNYVWSDSVSDGVPFIPLASHTYTVIGTDANNNCSGTALRAISVFLLPDVGITASPSVTICLGDSVLLKGTGANTYDWSDNVMDSVSFSPQATTTYYVTGKDQYSCADTASQLIIVDSSCNEIIGVGIIESLKNSIKINIYPNPNNGKFTITGTSDGTYAIINDLGQTIQQFKLNSTNQYSINIENLNNGMYYLVGYTNEKIMNHKIIVIK